MLYWNSSSLEKLGIDFQHQFYKNQEFRNQKFDLVWFKYFCVSSILFDCRLHMHQQRTVIDTLIWSIFHRHLNQFLVDNWSTLNQQLVDNNIGQASTNSYVMIKLRNWMWLSIVFTLIDNNASSQWSRCCGLMRCSQVSPRQILTNVIVGKSVLTVLNHIQFVFLPQYQRQRKCFFRAHTEIGMCYTLMRAVLSGLLLTIANQPIRMWD